VPDASGAPRLALHAAELGFVHPITGETLHWTMPLPEDLQAVLQRLRSQPAKVTVTAVKPAATSPRSVPKRRQRRASHGNQVDRR